VVRVGWGGVDWLRVLVWVIGTGEMAGWPAPAGVALIPSGAELRSITWEVGSLPIADCGERTPEGGVGGGFLFFYRIQTASRSSLISRS
jgi:hypothetical protein